MDKGSSPRARGAVIAGRGGLSSRRIIPARAGSRSSGWASSFTAGDHPRARGEQQLQPIRIPHNKGSSPRARGAAVGIDMTVAQPGIIPARAGSRLKNPC